MLTREQAQTVAASMSLGTAQTLASACVQFYVNMIELGEADLARIGALDLMKAIVTAFGDTIGA